MSASKLNDLKKEIISIGRKDLETICLQLAKHKVENKDLLAYLLFDAEDPIKYASKIKLELDDFFQISFPAKTNYNAAKLLRKAYKLITKYSKFTKSAAGEIELILHFSELFLNHFSLHNHYQPLRYLYVRSISRTGKIFLKLHEDIRMDYKEAYIFHANKALQHMNYEEMLRYPIHIPED